MIFFLGCDVSKAKLDVSLVDERGIELWHDQTPNEPEAIAVYLLTLCGAYPTMTIRCVVEATGILHLPLADVCQVLGVTCLVYHPLQTKQQIAASVRGKKTDRTDAILIARVGLMGEAKPYVPDQYKATKYYARGQQKLTEAAGNLKRYEAHLTDILEAELTQAAKDILAGIQQQFKAARKQFIADTAATAPAGLMVQLQSIPGIGPYVAASLIGEIQDVTRFNSSKALIAYVGLDPKIRQSGHSLNSTGRLSKRGSPHVRRSLFIAANVARQHDPNFKALYNKKRTEGKRHTVALCIVARSILKTVRAVWLRGTPYEVVFDQCITEKVLT